MNILLTLLNEQLKSLLHADAEITESKTETLLVYANPYGGNRCRYCTGPEKILK